MMSPAEVFEPLRCALEQTRIRYAIGGSWASTAFGEARSTNDVDILGEFTEENVLTFVRSLPDSFYVDGEEAGAAIGHGRSFNVIHMPTAFKFDFFPASAFALGKQELDRAIHLSDTELSKGPAPFVTPEDILVAKLVWFRAGGERSEVQWRDIKGLVLNCATTLDHVYLKDAAGKVDVSDLLDKALNEGRLT